MPKKIVIAEDEELIAQAYKDGLSLFDYEVYLARDGAEALEMIEQTQPDLVLLDLIMPTMNGFETLETLRNNTKYKNLPILVATNLTQASDEKRARQLGADDYFIKAEHSIKELADRIQNFLDSRQ